LECWLIFDIMAPWGWHFGAATCSCWYMSRMVYHRAKMLGDISIYRF